MTMLALSVLSPPLILLAPSADGAGIKRVFKSNNHQLRFLRN
jgi:hypothetical protein